MRIASATHHLLLAAALSALVACETPARSAQGAATQPVHVDSILPIEEELRRFRATLDEQPESLEGGEESRDALVAGFVAALATEDLGAAEKLRLSRAEFAHLYYPHTRFTSRPYELSPAIVWFQLENYSGRGLGRAMQRYGGSRLDFVGYRCPEAPTVEGENRIWTGCVIDRRRADGRAESISLLGPILERDGRFKFLSHANAL